jgi:3-methylcrotonyl-CoA carboxylase alpha subunit
MEFPLLVNKEPKSLTIAPLPPGEGHSARIGGREYRLRWIPINDNEWLLDVDGHPIRACLATRGSETWVSIAGETYLIEEAGAAGRPRRRGGPDDQTRQVTPPMPAAVIRILVAEGDPVNKGQSLIVLLAMKMEATLTAPYRGVVNKIHAAVGAQVMPGEILLEIEPVEEGHDGV